jgi:hypothetical protein
MTDIAHYFPLFNFTNLLHKPEIKKAYGGSDLMEDDVMQVYNAPKWLWRVAGSYEDARRLHQLTGSNASKGEPRPRAVVPRNPSAAAPQARDSVWSQIKQITESEEYDSFLSKFSEMSVGDAKNFGVTTTTTADALKMNGDQKLRRLRLILDSFGVKRGEVQVMFHEEFIQVSVVLLLA